MHTGEQEDGCVGSTCQDYTRMLSGLAMLRDAGADRSGAGTTLALNFSNPFPFLLDRPSPSGSPIWLHDERSFSTTEHVAPERLFADVGYVMIAKNEPNAASLVAIYEPYLSARYALEAENDQWRLLVARPAPDR